MLENVRSGFATLEKKLYRLVIAGLDGDRIGEEFYRRSVFDLAEKGICGFILSGGIRENVKSFVKSLRSLPEQPLFVASEMSNGTIGRVRGLAESPSFMALAAAADNKDPERRNLFKRALTAMASDVMDCGINILVVPAQEEVRNGDGPFESPEAPSEVLDSARIREECIRILQNTGLLVYEKSLLPEGSVSYRPAVGDPDLPGKRPAFMVLGKGTGREPAAYLNNGADILVDFEEPDATVQELIRAVGNGMIPGERIDGALTRIEGVKSGMAGPHEVEVNQALGEHLWREISQMAVTIVKGKGRFFPLRDSDNIPLVYAGDEEYFRTSPLRFYVKQASHVSRPLSSKERPAMFLLFGSAAAERVLTDSQADEMESLSRLIRAMSPSVVVSFGSPHALTRFKNADVLIAAYDSTSYAQEAVFKCITGERGFRGQLPVTLNIPDKKGRQR